MPVHLKKDNLFWTSHILVPKEKSFYILEIHKLKWVQRDLKKMSIHSGIEILLEVMRLIIS